MRAIMKREMQGYFHTPVGYIYLGVFLAIAGLVFRINNVAALSSDLSGFFLMMSYVWMLLCPVLVMRAIAGERKQQTDQLLMTAPLRSMDIVLGKYFGACGMLVLSVLLSFLYPLLVAIHGRIYPPELATAYLGFTLQGLAFIAFDLMLSALTANPVSAAVLCFGGNLLLWLSSLLPQAGVAAPLRAVLVFFNLHDRFTPFLYGQMSFANVVFFLGFMALCLMVCERIIEGKRRSRAT
ncbi:MAG: ABC transporter permease [Christensenellales bacterium]